MSLDKNRIYTKQDIIDQLSKMNIPRDRVVLMHSSLRSIGKIEGGYILLVGVGHNRNTYIHCVEEILGADNRVSAECREVAIKLKSGEIVKRSIKTHFTDYITAISKRFPKYEMAFRYHGAITDGFIGNAPTQSCDARIIKETIEKIRNNSGGIDPLYDDDEIPPKWYC